MGTFYERDKFALKIRKMIIFQNYLLLTAVPVCGLVREYTLNNIAVDKF